MTMLTRLTAGSIFARLAGTLFGVLLEECGRILGEIESCVDCGGAVVQKSLEGNQKWKPMY